MSCNTRSLSISSSARDAAVNALKEVSHKWSNGRLKVIFGAKDAVEAWLKALADA